MWDELMKDAERLEEIMERLGNQIEDIWQSKFIYWIAKSVYDVIKCQLNLRKRIIELEVQHG